MTRAELLQIAKPCLFNTDMTRAILEDRKTATRRCVKYKYDNTEMRMHTDKYGTRLIEIQKDVEGETHGKNPDGSTWHKLLPYIEKEPPFKKGDILYVRETWQCWRAHRYEATADIKFRAGGEGVRIQFANGNTDSIDRYDFDTFVNKYFSYYGEWKPSIFMPKEAARIFLKVNNVRVERLQDITEDGAVAEGIYKSNCRGCNAPFGCDTCPDEGYDEIDEFVGVWNSTIKKSDLALYGWDANPWVWVIEFERIEPESEV